MKDISAIPEPQDLRVSSETSALPGPKGVGMAVSFDWGLGVQILVQPFILFFIGKQLSTGDIKPSAGFPPLALILVSIPVSALLFIFGEGVRRGWRWTRPVQVVVNALGFLGGFSSLWNLIQGSRHGNYWDLPATIIVLIISPLIAWRLNSADSKQWYARVTSAQARIRHGGLWIWAILLWATVGGVLQAVSAISK